MDSEFSSASEVYYHPQNLEVGLGRILWGTATEVNGIHYPQGWVLPGGRRTQSESIARQAAEYINRACRSMPVQLRVASTIPARRKR
jgi:hypothetical protein